MNNILSFMEHYIIKYWILIVVDDLSSVNLVYIILNRNSRVYDRFTYFLLVNLDSTIWKIKSVE